MVCFFFFFFLAFKGRDNTILTFLMVYFVQYHLTGHDEKYLSCEASGFLGMQSNTAFRWGSGFTTVLLGKKQDTPSTAYAHFQHRVKHYQLHHTISCDQNVVALRQLEALLSLHRSKTKSESISRL